MKEEGKGKRIVILVLDLKLDFKLKLNLFSSERKRIKHEDEEIRKERPGGKKSKTEKSTTETEQRS